MAERRTGEGVLSGVQGPHFSGKGRFRNLPRGGPGLRETRDCLWKRGGLETVRPFPQERPTGLFFGQPTADSLIQAVEVFERCRDRFDPQAIEPMPSCLIKRNSGKDPILCGRENIEAFCFSLDQGGPSC